MEMNGKEARILRSVKNWTVGIVVCLSAAAVCAWLLFQSPAQEAPACRPTQVAGMGLVLRDTTAADGLYVIAVQEDGLAQQSGIEPGDRLTALNGVALTTISALDQLLEDAPAEGELCFTLDRAGDAQTCQMCWDEPAAN